MGCTNQKSIKVVGSFRNSVLSDNNPFENGLVIREGRDYYLKIKNRYNDKMMPRIRQKFEQYMELQIEKCKVKQRVISNDESKREKYRTRKFAKLN